MKSKRFLPIPMLSTNHWTKHGSDALRHRRSGIIVRFLGPDPDASRRRCLRDLNKLTPRKPARLPKGGVESDCSS